jgi:hypothetical protein
MSQTLNPAQREEWQFRTGRSFSDQHVSEFCGHDYQLDRMKNKALCPRGRQNSMIPPNHVK